jgi:hypothetical protein
MGDSDARPVVVAAVPAPVLTNPRGLFDGFEAYVTPTPEDYKQLLMRGLVVLDANVLLNLYRYTTEARDDAVAVLDRLGDCLWVPHQALVEFWRNRESVLRDPQDTVKACQELEEYREKSIRALQSWANRVSLTPDRSNALVGALRSSFDAVLAGVEESTDAAAREWARDTNKDPVITKLAHTLASRVGPPLSPEAHSTAVVEGLRRVEAREPPGYKDKRKSDEGAAGDYLIWEQTICEVKNRDCDVLIVTGDVKEDWWREEAGERRGPRMELVEEMRRRSGRRLFMLRPTRLLDYARSILNVPIRPESVEDADRVDKLVAEFERKLPDGGWAPASLEALLDRLEDEAPVQADAIRAAAYQDGFISRAEVYELGDYPEDRSLRGFTRPINRIVQQFRDAGTIADGAVDVLLTVYNRDSPSVGWAVGFRIHADVLPLFGSRKIGASNSGAEDKTVSAAPADVLMSSPESRRNSNLATMSSGEPGGEGGSIPQT